jgi:hypothetical protein
MSVFEKMQTKILYDFNNFKKGFYNFHRNEKYLPKYLHTIDVDDTVKVELKRVC